MSERKESEFDRDVYFSDLKLQIYKRLVASIAFYSGALNLHADQRKDQLWQIIRYQRVVDPARLPYPTPLTQYVLPQTFERHLEYLRRETNVISLQALIELLEDGTEVPKRTVVITLDGGWTDTYTQAYPRLKAAALPATILLPTAFIGTNNLFWTEKIMAALIHLYDLGYPPSRLPLLQNHFPDLESAQLEDKLTAIQKIGLITNRLKAVPPEERAEVLGEIGAMSEAAGGYPIERQFLNWEEITEMATYEKISFGSLGHTHRTAPELSKDEFAHEVRYSYKQIVDHGIRPNMVFAFPRGLSTKEARQTLRELKLKYCLGLGDYPAPGQSRGAARILGRVGMYEEISHSKPLFACRLWRLRAGGFAF